MIVSGMVRDRSGGWVEGEGKGGGGGCCNPP